MLELSTTSVHSPRSRRRKERKEDRCVTNNYDILISFYLSGDSTQHKTGAQALKRESNIHLTFLYYSFRLSSSKGIITWFDAGLISKLRLELFVKICCWVCLFFSLQSGLEEIQQKFFNKFFSILLYFSNTSD